MDRFFKSDDFGVCLQFFNNWKRYDVSNFKSRTLLCKPIQVAFHLFNDILKNGSRTFEIFFSERIEKYYFYKLRVYI